MRQAASADRGANPTLTLTLTLTLPLPLTLTLTLTLTRLRQQTEELMQEPDFVEQITKAFAGIGEPPKKD